MLAHIAATVVLATTSSATAVGAAGGYTAWSEATAGGYVLVIRAPDGAITRPPVPPRAVPFDLDLGINAAGQVLAAYSRCEKEPTARGGANTILPQWTLGKGCSIHLLNVVTGTERALRRQRGSSSEMLPSVGGHSLVYIRPKAGIASLMLRDLRGGGVRQLESARIKAAGSKLYQGPISVDTNGLRVASVWQRARRRPRSFETEVRSQRLTGGRPRKIARASIGRGCKYETLLSPTLSGGSVFYLDTKGSVWGLGRTPQTRRRPKFGAHSRPHGWVPTSAAVDGQRLVVAETRTRLRGRPTRLTRIVVRPIGHFVRRTPVPCG
jgi:hypothetical protein